MEIKSTKLEVPQQIPYEQVSQTQEQFDDFKSDNLETLMEDKQFFDQLSIEEDQSLFNLSLTKHRYKYKKPKKKEKKEQTINKYTRVSQERRQIMLDIFRSNLLTPAIEISKLTQLSSTKILQIRKQYEVTGDIRITEGGNFKSLQRLHDQQKQKEAMVQIIKKNPRIKLQQILKELYKKYGIIVKRSTLHKRLVVDLNYQYIPIVSTYTPTFTQNDEDTLLRRYQFAKKLQRTKLQNIYVCGISMFTVSNRSHCAWLLKTQNQNHSSQDISDLEQSAVHSLITLNSSSGIVHFDSYIGHLEQQILGEHIRRGFFNRQNASSEDILILSDEICMEMARNYPNDANEHNQSITKEKNKEERKMHQLHYEKVIKPFLRNLQLPYLVFPPYSPGLNPCSSFYAVAQKKFRAYITLNRNVRSYQQIRIGIQKVMTLMPTTQNHNYFQRLTFYQTVDTKEYYPRNFIQLIEND